MSLFEALAVANLKPNSKKQYVGVLDPAVRKHGHRPAATMPHEFAVKMVQEIGRDRPGLANLARKVMHRIMRYGRIEPNPFDDIAAYKKTPYHTWTDAELKAFETRWPLGHARD